MTFRSQASVCVHMKPIPCNPECPCSVQKQLLLTDKYTKKFILWEHLFPVMRPCVLASVTNLFSQPPPTHISTICPLNKISSQNQF